MFQAVVDSGLIAQLDQLYVLHFGDAPLVLPTVGDNILVG